QRQTTWHSRDGSYRLTPCEPETARAHLSRLMEFYRRGLLAPLHFFPKSAWAYVRHQSSLAAARARWTNNRNPAWGESADPAFRLALRGLANPLDGDFEHCASSILGPMFDYLEDPRS
ncbi:MAG TPA: exodeoxyribonuclease V subunit gamma, partial [Accumulibacter sp.]|nr:exodeoxyribonuclease V subunit gamma [Accumulibacter sp.]